MQMQAAITEAVIDSPLRFSHCAPVPTHDEILAELIRQIDAGLVKQADVARALGIAPARVQEMRKGTRRIQPDEMPPLAALLGMTNSSPPLAKIQQSKAIPHWGKVAQGVWLEQSFVDPENPESVPYDREAGDPASDNLFAVTPEGTSMNKLFPPGMKLICERIPFGDREPESGALVIVQRSAHDLYELTCKRFVVDDEGVRWLHSESTDPAHQRPMRVGKDGDGADSDVEIQIIGEVLRGVIDYRGM